MVPYLVKIKWDIKCSLFIPHSSVSQHNPWAHWCVCCTPHQFKISIIENRLLHWQPFPVPHYCEMSGQLPPPPISWVASTAKINYTCQFTISVPPLLLHSQLSLMCGLTGALTGNFQTLHNFLTWHTHITPSTYTSYQLAVNLNLEACSVKTESCSELLCGTKFPV
jgi:hypothetical protein